MRESDISKVGIIVRTIEFLISVLLSNLVRHFESSSSITNL